MTSANIVGYQTVDSPAASKYKAFTVSFEDVKNGDSVKIAELLSGSFLGKPAFNDAADQIWLWDSANDVWIQYFFRRTAGGSPVDIGWCKKGEQSATTESIPAGEGFFFRRANLQADATITFTYGDAE